MINPFTVVAVGGDKRNVMVLEANSINAVVVLMMEGGNVPAVLHKPKKRLKLQAMGSKGPC